MRLRRERHAKKKAKRKAKSAARKEKRRAKKAAKKAKKVGEASQEISNQHTPSSLSLSGTQFSASPENERDTSRNNNFLLVNFSVRV